MITLVLGGARSGKSGVAESLLGDDATYVATGAPADPAVDPQWAAKVERHRARRPSSWTTVETTDLAGALRDLDGHVLVDSLGTWVAAAPDFAVDADGLCDALRARHNGRTVLVSDEVGLGVHPPTAIGVAFRDALGDVNRAVADVADEVLLVIAGRVLKL